VLAVAALVVGLQAAEVHGARLAPPATRLDLPQLYLLSRVQQDLCWAGATVPGNLLVDAYRIYLARLTPAMPRLMQAWALPSDTDSAIASRTRAMAREFDRFIVEADAAENAMWDSLLAVPGHSEESRELLTLLKACRDSERLSECAQARNASFEAGLRLPTSSTVAARSLDGTLGRDPSVRATLLRAAAVLAAQRTAAWRLLYGLANPPPHSRKHAAALAAVRELEIAEFARLRALLPPSAGPPAMEAALKVAGVENAVGLGMPHVMGFGIRNPRALARWVLASPDLTANQRTAARAILRAWITEHDTWVERRASDSSIELTKDALEAQFSDNERSLRFLSELHAATGLAWLDSKNELARPPAASLLKPLDADDEQLAGVTLPMAAPSGATDDPWLPADLRLWVLPSPLPSSVVECPLADLAAGPATASQARVLWNGYRAAWQERVAPVVARLITGYQPRSDGGQESDAAHQVAQLLALAPDRRLAWETTLQLEKDFMSALQALPLLGEDASGSAIRLAVVGAQAARTAMILQDAAPGEPLGATNAYLLLDALAAAPDERRAMLEISEPLVHAGADAIREQALHALALLEAHDAINMRSGEVFARASGDARPSPATYEAPNLDDRAALQALRARHAKDIAEAVRQHRAMMERVVSLAAGLLPPAVAQRAPTAFSICNACDYLRSLAALARIASDPGAAPAGSQAFEASLRESRAILAEWEAAALAAAAVPAAAGARTELNEWLAPYMELATFTWRCASMP